MVGGKAVRFLFRASLRLFFCQTSRFLFSLAPFSGFSPKLRFDLRPQASLFFSAAACVLFSFASGVFFSATTLSLFSQTLGFFLGLQACLFTSLHAFHLFFDGAESCFGPAA